MSGMPWVETPPDWITDDARRVQPVKSCSITFRLSEAELRAVCDEADRTRANVSHLLRTLVLDSVGKNAVLDEGQIGYRPSSADWLARFQAVRAASQEP